MLAKNPDDRLSVVDVLAHPWTLTHYASPKYGKTNANDSSQSFTRTLKESTMAPYISQLFDEEVEIELENRGFYNSVYATVIKLMNNFSLPPI